VRSSFSVIDHVEQVGLIDLIRAVVDVLHVEGVDLQDTKPDVAVPVGMALAF